MDDRGDILEVLRADVRRLDDQRPGGAFGSIGKRVDHAARGMHRLTWGKVPHLRANPVSQRAVQHVDQFFVTRIAMRRGNVRVGRDGQLEYSKAPILRTIDEVADAELADLDVLMRLPRKVRAPLSTPMLNRAALCSGSRDHWHLRWDQPGATLRRLAVCLRLAGS